MTEILNEYDSITLDEMRSIRLMNRIDTKFVTTVPMLRQLLLLAKDDYFVQESQGERISPYYTLRCTIVMRQAISLVRRFVYVPMSMPDLISLR